MLNEDEQCCAKIRHSGAQWLTPKGSKLGLLFVRPLPRRGIGRTLVSGDSPPDLCPEGALGGIAPAPAPAPPNF